MNEKGLTVSKKLDSGAEHDCFEILEGENGWSRSILKIPNAFGKLWQTQGKGYMGRCLQMLDRERVKRVQVEIHENVRILHENGDRQTTEIAFEAPFIENIEALTVKYKDLIDPETGPKTIKEFMEIVKAADRIYKDKDHPRGLDPYGGEIVTDMIKGLLPALILRLSDILPKMTGNAVRSKIRGIQGKMRNFIRQEDGLLLIDPGMHDFSEEGKFKPVTKFIHHLMFASLIEILKYANLKMPKDQRINPEELESLPFNGTKFHIKLAKELMKIMIPIFRQYDKFEATRNQPKATDLSPHDDTKPLRI